jgi:hypothetical protein
MALDYLEFDYSEDEEGTGTWDAMASVKAERVPALAGEIEALLRWASQKFAGRQGPWKTAMTGTMTCRRRTMTASPERPLRQGSRQAGAAGLGHGPHHGQPLSGLHAVRRCTAPGL